MSAIFKIKNGSRYMGYISNNLVDFDLKKVSITDRDFGITTIKKEQTIKFVPKYHNCPNCCAVVTNDNCPYCGTSGLYKYIEI